MEAILDTNFMISCVKRKIDFFSHLEEAGFRVAIPREVMDELKDLKFKVRHYDKEAINIVLELLSEKGLKKIKLGQGKVDDKLIEFGRRGAYIATLDSYIKRSVPNIVTIDSRKNGILIERK